MKDNKLMWFLLALLIATIIFCERAGADDHNILQYVAGIADNNAEAHAKMREELAGLKSSTEWNTWMLRGIVGAIVTGAIGMAWSKFKEKA